MGPQVWPFDKLRTGFSLDAGVRIEAHDRKGLESHGQGVALLDARKDATLGVGIER